MPLITRTIHTDLEVEAVFDYVADFSNIADWDPGVTSSEMITDGPIGVGTEYTLDLKYGGSPFSMVYRIVEWDPPHLVVLEGDGTRSKAVDRIAVTTRTTGTVVDYEAEIQMKGPFRLVQPFLGKMFRSIGDGAANGLDRQLKIRALDGSS